MTAKRILHVDDTWECRKLVSAVLKHAGFEVIEAEEGLQGVALAKQERPDLILMDLHLPDISGLEATEQIKRIPELAHVAIIALTATEKSTDYPHLMKAGCCDYLQKPFSPSHLVSMIRQHLQNEAANV